MHNGVVVGCSFTEGLRLSGSRISLCIMFWYFFTQSYETLFHNLTFDQNIIPANR